MDMIGSAPFRGRQLTWAGYALGFALGGFFDGILLHQVLQWHHLLSDVAQMRDDLPTLILTDGLFHALMYLVAIAGLLLLWRAKGVFATPDADRRLFASALLGFGLWHILDGILSHWVLGIHRVRMDVNNPLLWDVLWLVAFGLLPVVLAWLLGRGIGRQSGAVLRSSPLALSLAVIVAGWSSLLPPTQNGSTKMVLFGAWVEPPQALAAIKAIGGRVLWIDASGQLWALRMAEGAGAGALYLGGALLVSDTMVPVGCLAWSGLESASISS